MIVAAGSVYKWAKEKSASTKDEQRHPDHTSRPAPYNAPWPAPAQTPHAAKSQANTKQAKAAQSAPKIKPVTSPAHVYKPLTNIPENDTIMCVEELEECNDIPSRESAMSPQEHNARQAHYERWRRAIIDTQILERKF